MNCELCGSTQIIKGKLTTGLGGVVFSTEKSQKRFPFTKNYSLILASACKDCGHIFSLKLVSPNSVNENNF